MMRDDNIEYDTAYIVKLDFEELSAKIIGAALKATGLKVGLLFNIAKSTLEIKRVVN